VEKHTTIAVDIAKSVFELAESNEPGRVSRRRRLSRSQMLREFTNRAPVTVVMEACGSAHYWGRELLVLGHEVRLLPARHVIPYRLGDKTDRTDADALLEARRNEKILAVPVKLVSQQALGFLHRARTGWMQTRTARLNAVRGILRELGVCIPVGAARVLPGLGDAIRDGYVPESLQPVLLTMAEEIRELETRVGECEKQLERVGKQTPGVDKVRSVPGIGLLGSTALAGTIVDPTRFPSGRHMAAFIGLVPREASSGSQRRLGPITKRGDPYLRTLLIHGARSVLLAAKKGNQNDRLRTWALEVQRRHGHNKAAVALANKMVRIAWAVWVKGVSYLPTGTVTEDAKIS
jgi:transposase